jgi:4-aminobutyrate aminotransferase-like enzyme
MSKEITVQFTDPSTGESDIEQIPQQFLQQVLRIAREMGVRFTVLEKDL